MHCSGNTECHHGPPYVGCRLVNISSNPRVSYLDYIVQGHRFDILEDVGCYPVVYNTLPAYFIYFMWPVVLGVISFCFSGSSIFRYSNSVMLIET